MFKSIGRAVAAYLSKPIDKPGGSGMDPRLVADTLIPGDVLLVEGNTRLSAAIRYPRQSTWSHAALFVGVRPELPCVAGREPPTLIEADVLDGVRAVPLAAYSRFRVRICRPVNLTPEDCEWVIQYAIRRLGHQYDLKNVLDLARYLFPIPAPARLRPASSPSAAGTRPVRSARR